MQKTTLSLIIGGGMFFFLFYLKAKWHINRDCTNKNKSYMNALDTYMTKHNYMAK